jgi:hypothetical protein
MVNLYRINLSMSMTFDNLVWIDTNYVNMKENWHCKAHTKYEDIYGLKGK